MHTETHLHTLMDTEVLANTHTQTHLHTGTCTHEVGQWPVPTAALILAGGRELGERREDRPEGGRGWGEGLSILARNPFSQGNLNMCFTFFVVVFSEDYPFEKVSLQKTDTSETFLPWPQHHPSSSPVPSPGRD